MYLSADSETFDAYLSSFVPNDNKICRTLAIYSAAVALADYSTLDVAVELATKNGATRDDLYEIILQSYLFLGFPRMLEAADHLEQHMPNTGSKQASLEMSSDQADRWSRQGTKLCRQIYGDNFERLKERVERMAPEIFQWMIVEGYGKVLSRPQLNIVDRELSIVAFLMVERRKRQLHSHMKGALNAGASPTLLRTVIDDIRPASAEGHRMAVEILNRWDGAR